MVRKIRKRRTDLDTVWLKGSLQAMQAYLSQTTVTCSYLSRITFEVNTELPTRET